MNKLLMFLTGVMMLVIVFIAMFFTGAIFDASQRGTVETYFFQGNNYSYQRPGVPQAPRQMGDSKLFALLVTKYVTEYLYVLPEVADIDHRISVKGALNTMSNPLTNTFDKWKTNIAPEIRKMAESGVLRTVSVDTPLKYGDFYQVEFVLNTWTHPNDMDEVPTKQSGIMQFRVAMPSEMTEYRPEINEEKVNQLHERIDAGYDPVGVFNFKVSDVIIHME
ncbi:MAG: hypothetical protein K2M34_01000 [Alphaproteobacteria bacterium]|nr:hypothetical protein [Alphaproteobacteria bacterium]